MFYKVCTFYGKIISNGKINFNNSRCLEVITTLVYSMLMNQLDLFDDLFDEKEEIDSNDPLEPKLLEPLFTPLFAPLYELSADAYFAALYAKMSELPIKNEISRFIDKVCKAAEAAGSNFPGSEAGDNNAGRDRAAASRAATDRSDPDVLAVLKAAGKVQHEIHRMIGFLRFSVDTCGMYTARCAPDHYILPALAEHFTLRFGDVPWAIIDEKRGLCLSRKNGGNARISQCSAAPPVSSEAASENEQDNLWEGLWQLYHRSVNNKARKNPKLQRQLMPERYQKYLTELKP